MAVLSRLKLQTLIAIVAGAAALAPLRAAASDTVSEYQVKAAYLYKFLRFVDWPAGMAAAGNPLAVCVIGRDPFGSILEDSFRAKTMNNQPVVVRRITAPQQVGECRVLFVGELPKKRLQELLEVTADAPVLTVGDMDSSIVPGILIGFYTAEGKVLFDIRADAAKKCGLHINAQLLKLSRSYR